MKNSEKQIKEFLNDKEKIKALANDEQFIEKVSGGTATAETYQNEFKKFGIELSNEDAKHTKDVADKIFEKPDEKLDDEFLKEVSGGSAQTTTHYIGGAVAGAAMLSGLGCSIASCAYASKAAKAASKGKKDESEKYLTKSKNCGIAAASLTGVSAIGGAVYAATPGYVEDLSVKAVNWQIEREEAAKELYEKYYGKI